jgi:transposase
LKVSEIGVSLIHTSELVGVNPFDYLNVLQQHRDALAATPAAWMPWDYRDTLVAVTTAA